MDSVQLSSNDLLISSIISQDLQNPTEAFGARKWQQYLGVKVEEPALPSNIQDILSSPCPFWKGKTVKETHILVLLPKMIDDDPLTLNSLNDLLKRRPNEPFAKPFEVSSEELNNKRLPASYWVLMTKEILPDSQSKSYAKQQELLDRYPIRGLYEIPCVLELVTCIFMHYLKTGERLYSENYFPERKYPEGIYTHCQEKSENVGIHRTVGAFSDQGLQIKDTYWSGWQHNEHVVFTCLLKGMFVGSDKISSKGVGLACLRKL